MNKSPEQIKRIRKILIIFIIVGLIMSLPLFARFYLNKRGNIIDIAGPITSVSDTQMIITRKNNTSVTVLLDENTTFRLNGSDDKKNLDTTLFVIVHGKLINKNTIHATSVRSIDPP